MVQVKDFAAGAVRSMWYDPMDPSGLADRMQMVDLGMEQRRIVPLGQGDRFGSEEGF
jgi:hypothetical protein